MNVEIALNQLNLRVEVLETLMSIFVSRNMSSPEIEVLAELMRANTLKALERSLGDLSTPAGQGVVDVVMADALKVTTQALAMRAAAENEPADKPRH